MHLQDYDPLEQHRVAKVADREDEYRSRHRKNLISPERIDPFADGKFLNFAFSFILPAPFKKSLIKITKIIHVFFRFLFLFFD